MRSSQQGPVQGRSEEIRTGRKKTGEIIRGRKKKRGVQDPKNKEEGAGIEVLCTRKKVGGTGRTTEMRKEGERIKNMIKKRATSLRNMRR